MLIGVFFKQLDNLITLHQCEYIFGKQESAFGTSTPLPLNLEGIRGFFLCHYSL